MRSFKTGGWWAFGKIFRVSKKFTKNLPDFRKKIQEIKKIDIKEVYKTIPKLDDTKIEERIGKILEMDKKKEAIFRFPFFFLI